MNFRVHDPDNMTRMYKKTDFSYEALRSFDFQVCEKNGEIGLVVWTGTKSQRQALKKLRTLKNCLMNTNIKTLPRL